MGGVASNAQEITRTPKTTVNDHMELTKDRISIPKSNVEIRGKASKKCLSVEDVKKNPYPPLPRMVWTTDSHHLFPPSFRKVVYTFLCCHYAESVSGNTEKMIEKSCKAEGTQSTQ